MLALALAVLAAAPTVESRDHGFDAIAVPLLSYNSDLGLGYGAVGGVYLYSPDKRPFAHAISAQTFFTTRGVQNHFLRYDGPQLFGTIRVEGRLEFKRELFAPYYGMGNISSPEFTDNFSDRRYAYDRTSPGGWVRFRFSPLGLDSPLHPYLGYANHYESTRLYEGSLLQEQAPLGVKGGFNGQFQAGVFWDTRDDESNPTRGGVEELSVRGADSPTGSAYRYAGVTLSEKRFVPVWDDKLVVGERLTFDALTGEAPFFEWYQTGGLQPLEGLGGMSSIRGIPRNRYGGNMKLLSNSEVRFSPFAFPLWGQPVKVGVLGFVDVGHAWAPVVNDGGATAWHSGFGGGLRLARRAAVLRFDLGWTPELNRKGVYVAFGHMF